MFASSIRLPTFKPPEHRDVYRRGAVGCAVNETDPFKALPPMAFALQETSPHVNRVRMAWDKMRADVLQHFLAPPPQTDSATYLQHVGIQTAPRPTATIGMRLRQAVTGRVFSGSSKASKRFWASKTRDSSPALTTARGAANYLARVSQPG